jgi:drug/metabolite transporter (DMT)-like permease
LTLTTQARTDRSAYFALIAVCLLWGTTYLGIRIALEGLPALYLIAIRYTISGGLLLLGASLFGVHIPRGRELWQTGACGAICIGIGNGLLAIAEKNGLPSGMAALFYSTAPFLLVGIDALLPGGKVPSQATIRGLIVGVAGVIVLILPTALRQGIHGGIIAGFILIELSAAGWTLGALLQKRVRARASSFITGAVQQLAAGLVTFIPAALFEKLPHSVPPRTAWAVAYLVVFGSFIGFTCFVYCVAKLPVAIVSIYTFVNPVVAIFLGWLFFREPFGSREFVSMLIIFAGVALVRWSETSKQSIARNAGEAEALGPEP